MNRKPRKSLIEYNKPTLSSRIMKFLSCYHIPCYEMTQNNTQQIKSITRAFELIELVRELGGGTVTEVANEMEMPKSTVHRYLSTLEAEEYLVKNDEIYQISHRFLDLGEFTRTRRKAYELAEEKVKDLARETEERAQFIVEEHGLGVYLYRDTGPHAVETGSRIGKRIHLHSTAAGKAILAHLPRERTLTILDERGLPAITEHTTTDHQTLLDELEEIREQGFSLNMQENTEGARAIGVPIMDGDELLGALSITGPTNRMKGDRFNQELPDLLLGTADELELNIAYS